MKHVISVVAGAAACCCAWAQNLEFPRMPEGVNPVIDGQSTSTAEWISASAPLNLLSTGTYRGENQLNWTATSSSGNQATYNGTTLFVMHDISSAQTSELADYNTFDFSWGGNTVRAWIFANGDAASDTTWLGYSGIGGSSFDDRGFLVRLNNDPTTDRHWLPGMAEPGDAGWVWTDYYGFFGVAGFNNSAFQDGLPKSGSGTANEVYELALFGGIPATLSVGASDPKGGNPELPQDVLIDGTATVIPEPNQLTLPIAVLIAVTVATHRGLRRRGQK